MPGPTRGRERGRPQLLDVGGGGHVHRRDAPLERHVVEGVEMVGEADDRPPRTQTGDRRRSPAAERGHEQGLRLERFGDVAGGVRHRLPDCRPVLGLGELVPVAEARLDRAGNPVHVGDRLDRNSPTAVSPES